MTKYFCLCITLICSVFTTAQTIYENDSSDYTTTTLASTRVNYSIQLRTICSTSNLALVDYATEAILFLPQVEFDPPPWINVCRFPLPGNLTNLKGYKCHVASENAICKGIGGIYIERCAFTLFRRDFSFSSVTEQFNRLYEEGQPCAIGPGHCPPDRLYSLTRYLVRNLDGSNTRFDDLQNVTISLPSHCKPWTATETATTVVGVLGLLIGVILLGWKARKGWNRFHSTLLNAEVTNSLEIILKVEPEKSESQYTDFADEEIICKLSRCTLNGNKYFIEQPTIGKNKTKPSYVSLYFEKTIDVTSMLPIKTEVSMERKYSSATDVTKPESTYKANSIVVKDRRSFENQTYSVSSSKPRSSPSGYDDDVFDDNLTSMSYFSDTGSCHMTNPNYIKSHL